eukprot:1291400-Amphidinium_carterae.1
MCGSQCFRAYTAPPQSSAHTMHCCHANEGSATSSLLQLFAFTLFGSSDLVQKMHPRGIPLSISPAMPRKGLKRRKDGFAAKRPTRWAKRPEWAKRPHRGKKIHRAKKTSRRQKDPQWAKRPQEGKKTRVTSRRQKDPQGQKRPQEGKKTQVGRKDLKGNTAAVQPHLPTTTSTSSTSPTCTFTSSNNTTWPQHVLYEHSKHPTPSSTPTSSSITTSTSSTSTTSNSTSTSSTTSASSDAH